MTQRAIGLPIGPLHFWDTYLWYYGGRKQTKIVLPTPGWVDSNKPLLTYHFHDKKGPRTLTIKSPFAGLIVRDRVWTVREDVDYGYSYHPLISRERTEFVVVRPLRIYQPIEGEPWEQTLVYGMYNELRDELLNITDVSSLFGDWKEWRKLDPNNTFQSRDHIRRALIKLEEVNGVWLPDWDFSEHNWLFQ